MNESYLALLSERVILRLALFIPPERFRNFINSFQDGEKIIVRENNDKIFWESLWKRDISSKIGKNFVKRGQNNFALLYEDVNFNPPSLVSKEIYSDPSDIKELYLRFISSTFDLNCNETNFQTIFYTFVKFGAIVQLNRIYILYPLRIDYCELTSKVFIRKLFDVTIAMGHIEVFTYLVDFVFRKNREHFLPENLGYFLNQAVKYGQLKMFKHIEKTLYPKMIISGPAQTFYYHDCFITAIKYNYQKIVKYFLITMDLNLSSIEDDAISTCLEYNRVEILKFLFVLKINITKYKDHLARQAIFYGNLEILKIFIDLVPNILPDHGEDDPVQHAKENNYTAVIKLLNEHGYAA